MREQRGGKTQEETERWREGGRKGDIQRREENVHKM